MRAYLLIIAAHCDDAELWAGGTIARLTRSGKRVVVAIAHHDPRRRSEAEASANILGHEIVFRDAEMMLPAWSTSLFAAAQPEVFLTHPVNDPHFEHAALGAAAIEALTKSAHRRRYPQRWYTFDTYYSTTVQAIPILIDVTNQFDTKAASLLCHESQNPSDLIVMAKAMNSLNGQRIRSDYAESFCVFPLLGRWPHLRDLP